VTLGARALFGVMSGAAVALSLGLYACENDVSVHLLQVPLPAPLPSEGGAGGAPAQAGAAGVGGDPKVCVDGEPCSGLARALSFEGAYDRVEIPSSPLLDLPQDFTFEAWVLLRSYSGGHGVFNRWSAGLADIELTFGTPEPLPLHELPSVEPVPSHVLASWAFVRPDYWLTVVAPSLPSVEQWHHLASAYGAGSYRLYVDGVLVSSVDGTDPVANAPSTLFLGATARHERAFDPAQGTLYWPPLDGFIAEVRISSNNRYASDFVPEPRFSADASTIALWHLDEGSGSVAFDSGPSQLSGNIFGASWALAPSRNGPPSSL